MRFQPGDLNRHWRPRGPARHKYRMSDDARRQRRGNLEWTRLRSRDESLIIKLLVWQAFFGDEPKPSQRALGRELGVGPSYVCKVQKQATSAGWNARVQYGRRVSLDDLTDARRFTAKLREQGLLASPRGEQRRLAGAMTADEIISEQRRFAEEWKRKNPPRYDTRRRLSVSIPC